MTCNELMGTLNLTHSLIRSRWVEVEHLKLNSELQLAAPVPQLRQPNMIGRI